MRLMAILLLVAGPVFAETLQLVRPVGGEEVRVLTEAQRSYVRQTQRIRRVKFANEKYRGQELGLPVERVEGKRRRAFWPRTVELVWAGGAATNSIVTVTNLRTGQVVCSNEVEGTSFRIDNLEVGRRYAWTVACGEEVQRETFVTEDLAPRIIRVPGVPNVRDLGGWYVLDDRRIRQGMIYRSAAFNDNATKDPDGTRQVGRLRLSEAELAETMATLGIKTEIDLRDGDEAWGVVDSPLGAGVRRYSIPGAAYAAMLNDGRSAFTKIFTLCLDRNNYPMVIHGIAGQDRTGSVMFLLGALLGMDEHYLTLDWELTGLRNRYVGFRHETGYDLLAEAISRRYPADTIQRTAEKYVLALGFSREDIRTFRELMLE